MALCKQKQNQVESQSTVFKHHRLSENQTDSLHIPSLLTLELIREVYQPIISYALFNVLLL